MTDRCKHGVKGGENGACHACREEAHEARIQAAERIVIEAAEAHEAEENKGLGRARKTCACPLCVAVRALREAREGK